MYFEFGCKGREKNGRFLNKVGFNLHGGKTVVSSASILRDAFVIRSRFLRVLPCDVTPVNSELFSRVACFLPNAYLHD